jgi:hypothetical protein
MRPAFHPARSLAAVLVAGAWLAVLVGAGGCEVAVGGTIPAYNCLTPGAAGECPNNQVCNTHNQCVPVCQPNTCASGEACDTGSGLCTTVDSGMGADVVVVDTGVTPDTSTPDTSVPPDTSTPDTSTMPDSSGPCPGGIGCSCGGAGMCTSGVCGDQLTVTPGLYSANGSQDLCVQPCCTSTDCPSGSVCFATAAGGNYCVPPGLIGRSTSIGTGGGGATCQNARDCRSGLCTASHCVDTCCSGQATGECSGTSVCTFSAFPGSGIDVHFGPNCASVSGSQPNGHSCSSNSECASQICAADSMFGNNYCHAACRNNNDCTGTCDQGPCACTYVEPNSNSDLVAACVGSGGNVGEGQSCNPAGTSASDSCANGFCDTNTMKCTSVCFTNADCTVAGQHCRPELVTIYVMGVAGGSYSVLACGT